MLSIPTADELMGHHATIKNAKLSGFHRVSAAEFSRDMQNVQLQMIRLRHLDTMDAETKARALMVLDGTYHGQAIRQVASV